MQNCNFIKWNEKEYTVPSLTQIMWLYLDLTIVVFDDNEHHLASKANFHPNEYVISFGIAVHSMNFDQRKAVMRDKKGWRLRVIDSEIKERVRS